MAFGFRKSFKLAPGLKLSVGKRGGSVRIGGKNVGLTAGTSGTRVGASLPGTGISVSHKLRRGAPASPSAESSSTTAGKIVAGIIAALLLIAAIALLT